MRSGAQQLAALEPSVATVPHGRVLVGSNIDPRLFTLVEHETFTPRAPTTTLPTSAIYHHARSRLITYLFLTSVTQERLRTVTVSRGGEFSRFGESDSATRELRSELSSQTVGVEPQVYPESRSGGRLDMVVAELPGTDLRLGMSHGLLRACRAVLEVQRESIQTTAAERSDWDRFAVYPTSLSPIAEGLPPEEEEESLNEFRVEEFRVEVEQRTQEEQRTAASRAYDRGTTDGIEDLVGSPIREAETNDLELYTNDTYLSISVESAFMAPFTAS